MKNLVRKSHLGNIKSVNLFVLYRLSAFQHIYFNWNLNAINRIMFKTVYLLFQLEFFNFQGDVDTTYNRLCHARMQLFVFFF